MGTCEEGPAVQRAVLSSPRHRPKDSCFHLITSTQVFASTPYWLGTCKGESRIGRVEDRSSCVLLRCIQLHLHVSKTYYASQAAYEEVFVLPTLGLDQFQYGLTFLLIHNEWGLLRGIERAGDVIDSPSQSADQSPWSSLGRSSIS